MPVWGGFLTPVLQVLSDGRLRKRRDLQAAVFDQMRLSAEERAEVLPSGQHRANNRLGWALSGLYRAELVEKPARATFVITEAGRALLAAHPDGIDEKTLKALPAYQSYVPSRPEAGEPDDTGTVADPLEQIEAGISRLDAAVAAELLKRLLEQTPEFLEQTVLELLVKMGYGGAEQHSTHLGGSGDGGVDGVIDQDALGLDQIYVQAKRYAPENTVQRPALQEFVGALHGMGASRGIFITTSSFTNGARQYVQSVPTRIVLIDGRRLAALMIKYRVGAQVHKTFAVVEVDEDYFD